MWGKGYRYLVQFISERNLLGMPIFFKTTRDLNSYSDGIDIIDVEWIIALEEIIELEPTNYVASKHPGVDQFPNIKKRIAYSESYKNLNDAATHEDALTRGKTEIWYVKPKFFSSFLFGSNRAKKTGVFPTVETIPETHVLLGKVKSNNKDELFTILQGERWSPNGEASRLIKSKKLNHTSMSVGDIIRIGRIFWFCDSSRWTRIK